MFIEHIMLPEADRKERCVMAELRSAKIRYQYDRGNRLSAVHYSDGRVLSYTYDTRGNLASFTVAGPSSSGAPVPQLLPQQKEEASLHARCPNCQADFEEGSFFCNRCGASLKAKTPAHGGNDAENRETEHRCGKCGATWKTPLNFCKKCGTAVRISEDPLRE